MGAFTDAQDTVSADTLLEDGNGSYYAAVSGSLGTAYPATVATDGSVSFDSNNTSVDGSTFAAVSYVDGADAVTSVNDSNTAIGSGVETAGNLYALADDSGYVVEAGGSYYAADVSDPANVTWDSSTTAVASGDVDTSAAINTITVEGDASALIGSYYDASADTDSDGSNDVEFTGTFDTAAPLVTDVLSKQAALQAAQEEVTDREELIDDHNQTQALVDELAKLDKAVDDAEKALDEAGYVVESIDSGSEAGTADSDVFLLGDTDSIISGFELTTEEEAGDSIFIGEQLSIVVAGEDQDISDDLGDVSAQELIVIDDGANTTLYFEEKSFAGNGSTASDITTVELTGVTGGEVSINSDGFLTVA
ncbi:hypothetical protein ACRHM7_13000 [Chromohalobacter israelensis]|uniref:hypothetical protein n=1 Tax=Chromohalobacter israelensis TaxID=141390 RepID=UPI003D7958B0